MTMQVSQPSGMTLVEVLLALTLTALVLTTLTGLTRQILITERDVHRQTDDAWQRDAVFAVLRDDLEHRVKDDKDNPLEVAPSIGIALRLITLAPIEGADATITVRHPARVSYGLEPDPENSEEHRLVRIQEDLTKSKSNKTPKRQVIDRSVVSMHLRMFDGESWQSTWPLANRNDAVAHAIEIRILQPDEESVAVRRLRL